MVRLIPTDEEGEDSPLALLLPGLEPPPPPPPHGPAAPAAAPAAVAAPGAAPPAPGAGGPVRKNVDPLFGLDAVVEKGELLSRYTSMWWFCLIFNLVAVLISSIVCTMMSVSRVNFLTTLMSGLDATMGILVVLFCLIAPCLAGNAELYAYGGLLLVVLIHALYTVLMFSQNTALGILSLVAEVGHILALFALAQAFRIHGFKLYYFWNSPENEETELEEI